MNLFHSIPALAPRSGRARRMWAPPGVTLCLFLAIPLVVEAQPLYFVRDGALLQWTGERAVQLAAPAPGVAVGEFLGLGEGNKPLVKLARPKKENPDLHPTGDPSLADIALLAPDGTLERILAENAFRAFPSPTGRKIALIDADYSISILEGEERRAIALPERTVLAAWSPDETRLCLTVYPPDWTHDAASTADGPDEFLRLINNDLYLFDLATNTGERLTDFEGYDYGAQFSPDGKTLFFISSRAGRGAFFLLDLETRAIRQITNLEPGSYDVPVARSQTLVWLAADNSLAYEAQETPYVSSIRTVGADGSNPRTLGIGVQPRALDGGAGVAFLGPDGTPVVLRALAQ